MRVRNAFFVMVRLARLFSSTSVLFFGLLGLARSALALRGDGTCRPSGTGPEGASGFGASAAPLPAFIISPAEACWRIRDGDVNVVRPAIRRSQLERKQAPAEFI
ncbi:unnamed protein product [Prorocentrum cordatum]|uniref:Uncharacterized protein n=1 Tax=Prorocentrum cordatum TaxID=2364126 RepID=A0ABN9WPM6_9DINO|nr:unnamed protein product [Polarella glacialis]